MTLFAVHREQGPAWVEGQGAFDQPGIGDHAAYMNEFADDGLIRFAGTENGRIRFRLIAEATNETDVIG